MYEIENPETTALSVIQDLELPAELTQNNNFFGDNTSETLPQNVNFGDGSDEIFLEPSRMGSNLSLSDDSPATNEDPLTGEPLLDVISRESSQSAILPESINKLAFEGSRLLAGIGSDEANGIATDKDGNIYVTGTTTSPDFPITPDALQTTFSGNGDAFIAKISPDGTLLYSTYLGSSGNEEGRDIAVDDAGNIYVTGYTNSSDFPTVNALQNTYRGNDVFVTKISADGSNIIYSTYLGGQDNDISYGIAVDSEGNAYIAGNTGGSSIQNFGDFPITENAPQRIPGGEFSFDAFVSKISADGSNLLYSTLLGGSDFDHAFNIVLDDDGNAYIVGGTNSNDFPVVNATQSTYGGNGDIFIAQLNSDGSDLLYSTFYGGEDVEVGSAIAVDNDRNIYVSGITSGVKGDFPVVNAFQNTFDDNDGGVVLKINSDRSVSYASFLGIEGTDAASGIAVDATGSAYVVGGAYSTSQELGDFPNTFVTKVSSNGQNLEDSVIVGPSSPSLFMDIALDSAGNAYVAASTLSPENYIAGLTDAFVAKIITFAEDSLTDIFTAFDDRLYLAENPGVADAVAGGAFVSGLEHWIEFGFSEGRQPQIDFDEEFYLATYPEVAQAVANGDFANGLEHYVFFGAAENRQAVA